MGSFDFNYAAVGDVRAKPVQVFDNGRDTYFQFRAGEAVPAIFSNRADVPQLLAPVQEGPYIKVPEVHGRFVLQVGRSQANVVYAGGAREDSPMINVVAQSGLSTPYAGGGIPDGSRMTTALNPVGVGAAPDTAFHRNSYATPSKGDAVVWAETSKAESSVWFLRGSAALTADARKDVVAVARSLAQEGRIIVTGRDDDTLKEGLDRLRAETIADALARAGVDRSRITTRVGVAGKPRLRSWPSSVVVENQVVTAQPRSNVRANLEALIKAGVLNPDQASAIAAQHSQRGRQTAEVARPQSFTLTVADKSIQGALRRWAAQANYQIVWDAPASLDAQITGERNVGGSNIQEALERLLSGLKEMGYALDATVFSNRVIRLTPVATARPAADPAPTQPAPPEPRGPAKPQPRNVAQLPGQWSMRQGDANVKNMLSRWAAESQWNVVWNAADRVPITGDAVITGPTFKAAAESVIAQATAAGYRLRTTSTDDRTLVVSSF